MLGKLPAIQSVLKPINGNLTLADYNFNPAWFLSYMNERFLVCYPKIKLAVECKFIG